jgi:hypothetical protein
MLICMCWAPVSECGSWMEPAKFPIWWTLHASVLTCIRPGHLFFTTFFETNSHHLFYVITWRSVSRIGWKVIVRVLYILLGGNIPSNV